MVKNAVAPDGSIQMSFDLIQTNEGYIGVIKSIEPEKMSLQEIGSANKLLDEIEKKAFNQKEKKQPLESEKAVQTDKGETVRREPCCVWTDEDERDFKSDPDVPYWQKF